MDVNFLTHNLLDFFYEKFVDFTDLFGMIFFLRLKADEENIFRGDRGARVSPASPRVAA